MENLTPRAISHRDYGPSVYPRRHGVDVECDYCGTVETFPTNNMQDAYNACFAHIH